MSRAHLRYAVKDINGSVIQNALVSVYLEGTTTPVSDMYAGSTGGSPITTLTSNAQGEVEAWFTTPKRVDLNVTDNGDTAHYPGSSELLSGTAFTETVEVPPAPADTAMRMVVNDRGLFVSPNGGSDSNDGLSPGSAKASLAGALSVVPGTGAGALIQLMGGTHTLTSQTTITRTGIVIRGIGYYTVLSLAGTMTSGISITKGRNALENVRIEVASGTVTYGVSVDQSSGSLHETLLNNVEIITNGGTLTNSFAISPGGSGDVAGTELRHCRASNATNADLIVGNGTAGNVLNSRAYHCDFVSPSAYGIYMDGASLNWFGGSLQNHTTSDCHLGAAGTGPVMVMGVRSESSRRFWDCPSGTAGRPVLLMGINARGCTDAAGKHIVHNASLPLTIISSQFDQCDVASAFELTPTTYPLSLTAYNVQTESDDPFGSPTLVDQDIRNYKKLDASGHPTTPTWGGWRTIADGRVYLPYYSGTPEGNLTGKVGSTVSRIDGGTATSFYIKGSGTGNTGWKPVGALTGSKTHDWASVADGAQANTTVTVTGAAIGDHCTATMSVAVPAGAFLAAQVTAADTVTVTLVNHSGGAVDLASGTLKARVVPQ